LVDGRVAACDGFILLVAEEPQPYRELDGRSADSLVRNTDCGVGPIGYTSLELPRVNEDPLACQGLSHTDVYAGSEQSVFGSVVGSLAETAASDDSVQSITEEQTAGDPSTQISRLEHQWTFQIPPGSRVELHVEGFRTDSTDGDDFAFEYFDGGWLPVPLSSLPVGDDDSDRVASLPPISGSVVVRVVDTDRTGGNGNLDPEPQASAAVD
jgi:hypothetical protein